MSKKPTVSEPAPLAERLKAYLEPATTTPAHTTEADERLALQAVREAGLVAELQTKLARRREAERAELGALLSEAERAELEERTAALAEVRRLEREYTELEKRLLPLGRELHHSRQVLSGAGHKWHVVRNVLERKLRATGQDVILEPFRRELSERREALRRLTSRGWEGSPVYAHGERFLPDGTAETISAGPVFDRALERLVAAEKQLEKLRLSALGDADLRREAQAALDGCPLPQPGEVEVVDRKLTGMAAEIERDNRRCKSEAEAAEARQRARYANAGRSN